MVRLFLVVTFLSAGCGARSALLEPGDGGRSDGAPARLLRDLRTDGGCRVTLRVGSVKPAPASCWIDQKVANQTAPLEWDCTSGEAVARFAVPFVGRVTAGAVTLVATTEFHWSDGCTWQSRQQIEGVLATGALSYGYAEQPIVGTGCAPAYCKATASVLVE